MSNIIEPIKNEDGSVKTNVQIVRESAAILKRLRDGYAGQSSEARQREYLDYQRIINAEPQIAEWFEKAAAIEDEGEAQRFIERSLIPIETIRPDMVAPPISKAERIKNYKRGK